MKKAVTRKKAAMVDIDQACDKISHPEVPFALRLSGILMGVHDFKLKTRCFQKT